MPLLQIAGLTQTGSKHRFNQDALITDDEMGLLLLADGMGGYNAGDVASRLAVNSLYSLLHDAACQPGAAYHVQALLSNAVATTNALILHTSQTRQECAGMGTTLVVAWLLGKRVLVGHIGDSRLYRLRDNQLVQLTQDHSLVQQQVAAGIVSPEQARLSKQKNLVTRALGTHPIVALELEEYPVLADDIYLLCTDGLTDVMDAADIQQVISASTADLDMAAWRLVRLAEERGSEDDISVVLARPIRRSVSLGSWYRRLLGWMKAD